MNDSKLEITIFNMRRNLYISIILLFWRFELRVTSSYVNQLSLYYSQPKEGDMTLRINPHIKAPQMCWSQALCELLFPKYRMPLSLLNIWLMHCPYSSVLNARPHFYQYYPKKKKKKKKMSPCLCKCTPAWSTLCEVAVCESWLSVLVGRAGGDQGSFLPACLLEFLYWLFESALSRSLPTQGSLHQRSPKSVTQIWRCITRSAPWNDMYIMCNIVHIYSLDSPHSINTLIYFGEKIKPQITRVFFLLIEN